MSSWGSPAYGRLLALTVALAVAGCAGQEGVTVRFDGAAPVAEGDPVVRGGRVIGTVAAVRNNAAGMRVRLALDPDGSEGLMRRSAARVIERDGAPAVEVFNYRAGDRPVHRGDRLVALNSVTELVAWRTSETVNYVGHGAVSITNSMKDYFGDGGFARHRRMLALKLERLGSGAREALAGLTGTYLQPR